VSNAMDDTSNPVWRGVPDVGGFPSESGEAFQATEHEYLPWEKRVHALRELLATKSLLRVDELRRAVEGLGREKYERLSYYEQWISAIAQIMVERNVVSDHELGCRVAEVMARRV
jgi:Nitrile hydratase beta subunit.